MREEKRKKNFFFYSPLFCRILDQVWEDAGKFILEFSSANTPSTFSPIVIPTTHFWTPPPSLCFKLNVDASCDTVKGRVGISVVVRNEKGEAVFAAAVPVRHCGVIEVAEAKAVLTGLQLVSERGFFPLQVESDALNVIRLCK
ncbi:hypothetical protein ACOSQ3_004731 [Xanthoceras sorbifolium]